ncbi:hypothetical protein SBBP2_580006 [Burkholderiales bacterium]|nr:hypothetical protein SBBP2_580006 [Burkholderiales bacterium]
MEALKALQMRGLDKREKAERLVWIPE